MKLFNFGGVVSSDTDRQTFAGLAGLSISLALSVTQSLNWSVRAASDMESQMVSVERIKSYATMEQEAPHFISNNRIDWPSNGCIEFKDVKMKYREVYSFIYYLNVLL